MDFNERQFELLIQMLERIAVALETLASAPKLEETVYEEDSW